MALNHARETRAGDCPTAASPLPGEYRALPEGENMTEQQQEYTTEPATVAGQIKALLAGLTADVDRTRQEHDAARMALRDALASFRPAKKGRPAKIGAVGGMMTGAKRTRKPKTTETTPATTEE